MTDTQSAAGAARSSVQTSTIGWAYVAGLVLVVAIGAWRIFLTYAEFTQTWDEPAHIATGMEWLDRGTYRYEPQHPPLARVAGAIGLYLSGVRSAGHAGMWTEGNELLHGNGQYARNLALARVGMLPFFVLACLAVWWWARAAFGDKHALLAVALFSTLPPVLAHAGFATTDMALTAALPAALLAFVSWLEQPSARRAALLGVLAALAVLSKLTALLFLGTCGTVLWVLHWWRARRTVRTNIRAYARPYVRGMGYAVPIFFLIIWAGYRFSLAPMAPAGAEHATLSRIFGSESVLRNLVAAFAGSLQVPAPEFFRGILNVVGHGQSGHISFLLGEVSTRGWWYYFPVALAVKTPIPTLILGVAGFVGLWRQRRVLGMLAIGPAVVAVVMLLSVMPSTINIGVRHVLPIYTMLVIVAAYGFMLLWRSKVVPMLTRPALVLLVAWQVAGSVSSHPDYLAYFNESAGDRPEQVLLASDLDWGQDLGRLSRKLRELEVKEFSIHYNGLADLSRHGLPPFRQLVPYQPARGWIAISLFSQETGGRNMMGAKNAPPYDGFAWLSAYTPRMVVGKSIRLYYIE